jgi:hypothetical protein
MRGAGGNVKDKVNKSAAWTAQVLAIAAGSALLGTFVGQWMASLFGMLPQSIKVPLLVGAFLWALGDWLKDGVPNKQALYIAVVMPSLAAGLNGRLAANVLTWSKLTLGKVDAMLGEWVGTSSVLTVAAVLAVASFVIARHTVQER